VIIYYRSFLLVNACEATSTEAEAPNLLDEKTLILTKTVEWQSLIMMGDDGNSLRVSAYTCNYGTWNDLSQDVPAPNLRDEGTPRHATSGARIEFIWLHQNAQVFFIKERLRWAQSAAILK
jgi:hypothetical protein